MDLSWGSHIVCFRKYQLRLKELGLHLNKSLKHRRCISLVCMVWSFLLGGQNCNQKKRRIQKKVGVLRETVRRGGKSSPLTPKSLPVSTLIPSGDLAIFLLLDSVRHSCTLYLWLSVYFILSLLTTICEEHVTANILGFTWNYDQTDYTLQLYSNLVGLLEFPVLVFHTFHPTKDKNGC